MLYYADLRRTTEVVKTGFLIATMFIADAMIVSAHRRKLTLFLADDSVSSL